MFLSPQGSLTGTLLGVAAVAFGAGAFGSAASCFESQAQCVRWVLWELMQSAGAEGISSFLARHIVLPRTRWAAGAFLGAWELGEKRRVQSAFRELRLPAFAVHDARTSGLALHGFGIGRHFTRERGRWHRVDSG